MANTTSSTTSESVKLKRSIELSDDGSESASSAKKMKESLDDATTEKPLLIKEGKVDALDKTQQNTLKRPSEGIVDGAQCLSPSKKRKFVNTQEEPSGKSDNRLHGSEEIDKRKRRIKKKALLNSIMEQMEFYFCDSNLSKDRYLRKLYDETEDGYIDLEVFNNFNKLQTLLKGEMSLNILSKSLKKSKLLELNEDCTKVRRRIPLKELDQEEVNKRTVYVEHLPSHASHAWIRKIFSQCGNVCYVSLPTYQSTKDIKGFAFVEFGSAEEAGKACSMLNNPPPTKTEEKPGKFPKGNKFLYRAHKIVPSVKVEEPDNNEENLQSDSKEDQVISPTKKKKKKNAKRKPEESIEKSVSSEQVENQPDEKKKKKKKKKKQTPVEVDKGVKVKGAVGTGAVKGVTGAGPDVVKEMDNATEQKADQLDNNSNSDKPGVKKKKKRKKSKKPTTEIDIEDAHTQHSIETVVPTNMATAENVQSENMEEDASNSDIKLCRKERKRLRQEDIRKKKAARGESIKKETNDALSESGSKEILPVKEFEVQQEKKGSRKRFDSVVSESSETDDSSKIYRKSDGSQLTSCLVKSKKQVIVKKVEFDPVPVTTEFVERKEVRRRKKQKKESLHLRVLSKKDWLSLRAEYLNKQKSHMATLKESLRELRMKEGSCQPPEEETNANGKTHVDLTNVFGTKRMKPSQDVKMAHLEELKFIPNVIVQWKCSHEISRNKIKTMFKEIPSERIAYMEGKEEAESGYMRFKDEASAEEFARLSRNSDSFSARVLPESQQAAYWEKANQHRVTKLSRKRNERGTDKIARKVFEKNKATFHEKGSHIVFDDDENDDKDSAKKDAPNTFGSIANENQHDLEEGFLSLFRK